MAKSEEQKVFIVDDEPKVLKAMSLTVKSLRCSVVCFTNAAECLEALKREACDLLITDMNMPDMDGMDLLREAREKFPALPIIVVTGYGDIPIAVRAVKEGAFEFIEKPLDEKTFLPVVALALQKSAVRDQFRLTEAERRIVSLIADGKSNKEIAEALGRSVRTVENHRYRIMRKLDVESTAALIKRANEFMR